MGFLFFLLVAAAVAESAYGHDDYRGSSSLQLPLFHPRSGELEQFAAPITAVLDHDVARVRFMNSKLDGENFTRYPGVGGLIGGKSIGVPVNPGLSLGVGNYYTRIGIGTPASYHLVVVDTGSSFSWIQCQPCDIFCHAQAGVLFNPATSGTYRRLKCDSPECSSLKKATLNSPVCTTSNGCIYTATYGDQSYSIGYLSQDSLIIGSASLPGFSFGCGQDNEGLFGRSAGLLGLAKSELSLVSQFSKRYNYAFSYCLPTLNGAGGFLAIGGGSGRGYQYTPMLTDARDPTLYFLRLSAISVSGRPVPVSGSAYSTRTIIDSGTVITRLPPAVYSAFRTQVVKFISSKFRSTGAFSILDACFAGSLKQIAPVVPPIQLIFQGGAALNLSPQNALYEVKPGTTCLSFAGNSNPDDVTIIGNQQQQTFDIIYDVANSRIGFASGGCR